MAALDTYVLTYPGTDPKVEVATILKDPDAVLDYTMDWTLWLNDVADTIASFVLTLPTGITSPASSIDGTLKKVIMWLAGGTAGQKYTVECEITTNSTPPRKDARSIVLKIKDR